MQVRRGKDVRNSERRPFDGTVQVSWQDRSGEVRMVRAKCLDVSDVGVRIEVPQALETRASVYLQAPAFGLMGSATVRYCRRTGLKHTVGLMFTAAASQADRGRRRCIDESEAEPKE